jgi:hypothetical protein
MQRILPGWFGQRGLMAPAVELVTPVFDAVGPGEQQRPAADVAHFVLGVAIDHWCSTHRESP